MVIRNRLLYLFQSALAIIIIIIIFFLLDINSIISILLSINPIFLILAGFFYLINNVLMGLRLKKVLATLGDKIRFKFVFFSHMAGMFASEFTPARSGYFFTAYSLKRKNIPYKRGVSALTSTYVYDLFFKLLIAGFAVIYVYSNIIDSQTTNAIFLTLVLFSSLILLYYLIVYPPSYVITLSKKSKYLTELVYLGKESKKIHKKIPYILSISFIGWILRGFEWTAIALAIGIDQLSFFDSLFLNPLLTLFSLLPLTPAGWGIQEAGIIGVFGVIGIGASYAISFSLMTRFVEIIVDLIGIKELFLFKRMNQSSIEFYNTIDGDIDEKAFNSDIFVQKYWQQRRTAEITSLINISSNNTILDIGCGSGVQIQSINQITNSKNHFLGIDLNKNALKYARNKKIHNTDYIIANAEYLPIKDIAVDKIICAEIIEHLDKPEKLISETNRILKSGGEIVITTPNEISFWGVFEFFWDLFGRGRDYGNTHLKFYSIKELKGIFLPYRSVKIYTIFFITPLTALFGNNFLFKISQKCEGFFERMNFGMSIILLAKK